MSEALELSAEIRQEFGTGAARELRRRGKVPAIVYGKDQEALAISVEEKEITKHYRKSGFISTVINIKVGAKTHKVLPKAVELHPITDIVRHVDFVYLDKKTQKMQVPIVYEGKERALGVKRGGFFNIIKRTLTLVCDVNNIPKHINIDVTNMQIAQSLNTKNIKLPEGCTLASKEDIVIATIIGRRGGTKAEGEESATSTAEEAKK